MKKVTSWSNNDTKPIDFWTKATKNIDQWANNIVKSVVQVTPVAKNSAVWRGTAIQIPYTYDNSVLTYDSATYGYDYTNPTMNQLNEKNTTAWSAA